MSSHSLEILVIGLSFVWIHVSGMEKQFLCCLYKTGVISASISSWYLFCLLLEQWILLTALIAWRLLPDGDLFHTATSIPNWTTGWFIQWMSPSSCQSLLYHQQNITEIIRLTVCTCQKNLWRQREGERERESFCAKVFWPYMCLLIYVTAYETELWIKKEKHQHLHLHQYIGGSYNIEFFQKYCLNTRKV